MSKDNTREKEGLQDELLELLNSRPLDIEMLYGDGQIRAEALPLSVKMKLGLDDSLYVANFSSGHIDVYAEYADIDDPTFRRENIFKRETILNIPAEYVRGVALSLKEVPEDEVSVIENNSEYLEPDIKVYLAPSYEQAEEFAKTHKIAATVEAEYGVDYVEGLRYTFAHHEDRSYNCAPCIGDKDVSTHGTLQDGDIVLISHIDLDTIGGIMELKGTKPQQSVPVYGLENEIDPFWYSAAYIDVNGLHKEYDLPDYAVDQLHAYYAWAQIQPEENYTEVTDVTNIVKAHEARIKTVLSQTLESKKAIEEGREWKDKDTDDIEKQLVKEDKDIRVFVTEGPFCSSAYYSPTQEAVIPATVTLNLKKEAITVAFEDGGKNASAREIVQALWGPKAGGHDGIAGSPRGQKMTREDLNKAVEKVREAIEKQRTPDERNDGHAETDAIEDQADTKATDYLEETPDDTINRIMKQRSEKANDGGLDGKKDKSQSHDEHDDGAK